MTKEEITNLVDAKQKELDDKCLEIEKLVAEKFTALQPEYNLNVSVDFRDWSGDFVITTHYIDENGNYDFGSDATFYYVNHFGKNDSRTLEVNHGCCGAYDKSDTFQFARMELILKVFKNAEKIEKLFNDLYTEKVYKLTREIINLNKEWDKLNNAEEEAQMKNIEDDLKHDDLFYETNSNNKFAIRKVTDKYVYVGYEKCLTKVNGTEWCESIPKKFDKSIFLHNVLKGEFKKIK